MATEDFTIREVAERLGLSENRVNRLCRKHDIGRLRAGHRFLTERDIELFLRKRMPTGRPRKNLENSVDK